MAPQRSVKAYEPNHTLRSTSFNSKVLVQQKRGDREQRVIAESNHNIKEDRDTHGVQNRTQGRDKHRVLIRRRLTTHRIVLSNEDPSHTKITTVEHRQHPIGENKGDGELKR